MERVTIEHNGERITVEVPDGMSDEDILNFVKSQPSEEPLAPSAPSATKQVVRDVGGKALESAKAVGGYVVENPEESIAGAAAYGANKLAGNPVGKAVKAIPPAAYDSFKGMSAAAKEAKNLPIANQYAGMSGVKIEPSYEGAMKRSGMKVNSDLMGKIGYTAANSPVARTLGRSLAGAGVGLSGLDAIDNLEAGNYGQASLNALGALGSGLALAPHPVAKAIGIPLGMLGPAGAAYLKSLQDKEEEEKKKKK